MALSEDAPFAEELISSALGAERAQEVTEMLVEEFERLVTNTTIADAIDTPGKSECGANFSVGLHIGHTECSPKRWGGHVQV